MSKLLFQVLICMLAGMGAGLGTGFAGMSAAVVISPMLFTFLGVPSYEAIGIALASDVLASGISAYTYGKHKNLDIKNGLVMMSVILVMTIFASWIGDRFTAFFGNGTMGIMSLIMTIFLGLKFIIKPNDKTKDVMKDKPLARRIIESVVCGLYIGFVCGFIGAGGGLMMLFVLTTILGYEQKTAVGTSVFIMAFTALTGSVSHFVIGGKPNILILVLCMVFTFIWAEIAAQIANHASNKTLNRITGGILVAIGAAILIFDACTGQITAATFSLDNVTSMFLGVLRSKL